MERGDRRDLVIVGAGGFARETAQAVAAVNARGAADGWGPVWRLLGFLDDDPLLTGRVLDGVTVLGGTDLLSAFADAWVVVCVGNPRNYFSRAAIVRRLGLPEERYAVVVHPSAQLSPSSSVGPGSVILAQCALTASVSVGAHVAVMPQTVLTHDTVVSDFATLASGVRLGGGAFAGTGAYLGAGALIRERVRIGAWSTVGMGSVVLRDVPGGQVWAGNPARHLRDVDVPDALAEPRGRPGPAISSSWYSNSEARK
jgi:sugar O-acyltransferase (sialic acid O-acetyltransferase NeuD family)